MKTIHHLFFLLILIISNLHSHKIVLVTKSGEKVSIDSSFLTVGKLSSSISDFLKYDTIDCPAVFKKTLEHIALLLNYREKKDVEEIMAFFDKTYSNFSVEQIADLLNTFSFLNLEAFLELAFLFCPVHKEKDIFSLCDDKLGEKIKLFNSYLRLKIPLQLGNGRIRYKYINVPFNVACLLPRIDIESVFFDSKNEGYSLPKEPIEIELPDECIPQLPVDDLDNFFKLFFNAIANFNVVEDPYSGVGDFSEANLAVFGNLLDFFQCPAVLKGFISRTISMQFLLIRPSNNEFSQNLNPGIQTFTENCLAGAKGYMQGLTLTIAGIIYFSKKYNLKF